MPSISSGFGAYYSLPLSASALTRSSLTPDFRYDELSGARLLNSLLHGSSFQFTPGEISAAGLLGKIYLRIIKAYLTPRPHLHNELDDYLHTNPGKERANQGLRQTLTRFPTTKLYLSSSNFSRYLLADDSSVKLRHQLFISLILIIAADDNPFFRRRDGLFTEPSLRDNPFFQDLRTSLEDFYQMNPGISGTEQTILDFLREPSKKHPDSISDQLDFIRRNWSSLLGDDLLKALLSEIDRLEEEKQPLSFTAGPPQDPLGYSLTSFQDAPDQVRFSDDLDWMPRVILLAKNIFVWLDQLSRRYQRSIYQLDQIPEEEFARLADWGITTLWLIGIWERSPASQKIKHLSGNPDAVPSAYSLYDYTIASSIGGEASYRVLQSMAGKHNIRLAADMVPNHMGIYSRWILEHPGWFLGRESSPFPGYSFQGPDLCPEPSVGIFLEDHYYDKSDAAVVFKRVDYQSHSQRYIYHGNDGTSMPWNDTAQLDFLNPDVREAVIQTIIHVARKFPVIRFDAAMTLTKKHYQRLWFPEPGTGGAIPTRSEYSLSKPEFDERMAHEFWREVVDRVSQEAPDTLLLAEAFWMMEGYFVRSLGMHRVYNSAFMHMMRDEDNAKYRELIINTLEHDPQILKRYVNFMNNPDEETAVAQFGSDGKYFGTCLMMITLPGLPMFGHGQIEGFSEKYGMEYKRAYYDEVPNQTLIDRHKREIFPLLHKRYLFAEVDNFLLYDLETSPDNVYQDVLAFSNRSQLECALVLYHNKWGDITGRIRQSAAVNKSRSSLLNGLGFSASDGDFLLFKDLISGQEYIRSLNDLASHGLEISLGAYQYHVFLDFNVVIDSDGSYQRLEQHLSGKGCLSIEATRTSLILEPFQAVLIDLLQASLVDSGPAVDFQISLDSLEKFNQVLSDIPATYQNVLTDPFFDQLPSRLKKLAAFHDQLASDIPGFRPFISLASCFLAAANLKGSILEPSSFLVDLSANLKPHIQYQQENADLTADLALTINLIDFLNSGRPDIADTVSHCFKDKDIRAYLLVNQYQETEWFNKERFKSLLSVAVSVYLSYYAGAADRQAGKKTYPGLISHTADFSAKLLSGLCDTDFQVNRILDLISSSRV